MHLSFFTRKKRWKSGILFKEIPLSSITQQKGLGWMQSYWTQMEVRKHFVMEYLRGTGERDQTLLAGWSGKFTIKKLQLIVKNLHGSKQVGWMKWNSTWEVPNTFTLFILCAHQFMKIMQVGCHIVFKRKN